MSEPIRTPLGRMSLRERLMDFIGRLYREPPTCRHCGETMRYRDLERVWAWCCPNEDRDDHITPMTEALADHARTLANRHDHLEDPDE